MNAETYTRKSLEAIQTAQSMAQENHNQYITPEHCSTPWWIRTGG